MIQYDKKRKSANFGTTRKDLFKQYENLNEIPFTQYQDIINTFYKLLYKATIETGYMYKFPLRTGELGIVKKKQRKENLGSINWKEWRETGELKRYKNNHTGGWYAKILWDKAVPKGIFPNKGLFWFRPSREYKTALMKAIVDKNLLHKYYVGQTIHEPISNEE